MRLLELEGYEQIVIQCHDNPDPDAIAAGYALFEFFRFRGKQVRLIYGGINKISKSNIAMFIDKLNIPIMHVEKMDTPELLITVDCQYGAGNVTKFMAKTVVSIDHHILEGEANPLKWIDDDLASASTLVWDLLRQEDFNANCYPKVSTALYYGLFTDSSGFSEIHHNLDREMRDSLKYDKELILRLKNSILTLRELEIAGMALIRHSYNAAHKYVVIKAHECDPNILGLISDFVLQVDCVMVCVVYNEVSEGIKYSVRSCERSVRADELARFLAGEIGNGGGRREKAAGFISDNKYKSLYAHLNLDEYFLRKLSNYYHEIENQDSTSV